MTGGTSIHVCAPAAFNCSGRMRDAVTAALILLFSFASILHAEEGELQQLLEQEREFVALVDRLSPAVVCIFDAQQRGMGSGVLIDAEGYGLTNYHVVAGMIGSDADRGGLNDGKLYDLEVLGIDPTGDVAMFRLPGRDAFPYCELGDSDQIRVGDSAIAMGNPFSLSEDNTPTVSRGLVTGVHRYQWGVGNNLIYSDSIQVDASINPGNSGGPLFDGNGMVIGINGRISVNRRGRYNVGFGYAISINQIKRFIPTLRAGLLGKHGTPQAKVEDMEERGVVFAEIMRNASASNAGVRVGDRLLSLDGIPIVSRNHFASVIGTYPADWPVLLTVDRQGKVLDFEAQLDAIPPKLGKPFEPDVQANIRQAERVIKQFRASVLGSTDLGWPQHWIWTIIRRYRSENTRGKLDDRFVVTQQDNQPAYLRLLNQDESPGSTVEYTDQSAKWLGSKVTTVARMGNGDVEPPGDEGLEVPFETAMMLNALYFAQHGLARVTDPLNSEIHHRGGHAIRSNEMDDLTRSTTFRGSERTHSRIVEEIVYPLSEHVTAIYSFDVDTHRIVRIRVTDNPTGVEVVITLSDYRDIGAMQWPHTMWVQSPLGDFCDTLCDWQVSP